MVLAFYDHHGCVAAAGNVKRQAGWRVATDRRSMPE
jgi:hypothetical protein